MGDYSPIAENGYCHGFQKWRKREIISMVIAKWVRFQGYLYVYLTLHYRIALTEGMCECMYISGKTSTEGFGKLEKTLNLC